MEEIKQNKSASLNSDKMRSTKIGKLIWQMSLPAIFSMLVQALYNIVDSIFVSNITETKVGIYNGTVLGDDCFTAVSIVFPMTMFVIAIGIIVHPCANLWYLTISIKARTLPKSLFTLALLLEYGI